MECSISCKTFEQFSTSIHWLVCFKSNSKKIDHYLDDFFFAREAGTNNCTNLMNQFDGVCERLGVPIANEKTEGPTTLLEYLV
jgi:hypothetical protein